MKAIAQREENGNILFKTHIIYEVIHHLQVSGDKLRMYTINSKATTLKSYRKSPFFKIILNPKEDRKKDQRTDEIIRKQILTAR